MDDLLDIDLQKKLRNNFLENGFILFPEFLNKEEITLVKNKLKEFIKEKVSTMPDNAVYYEAVEDKDTLKQLQRLFEFDPFFFDMMFGSRFEKLASILLDDGVEGKNI